MADLTLRLVKGSPLTNAEVDGNFTSLNESIMVTGEPMGHANKSDSVLSFNAGTRTVSIAPAVTSFAVWCKGTKYTYTTAQTVVIPDTTGLHYVFFNASGVLSTRMSYFDFENEAPTSYVAWNSVTQQASFFADERHGVTLDWQTHEYLHRTRGAALANGFSISNYTIVGTGTADADAQFDLGGGTFFDEDLQVDIVSSNSPTPGTWQQDLAGPALIPVLYRSGTGWVRDTPTNFVLKAGTATPRYNTEAAGVWGLTDVPNNSYSVVWIIATNNLTYPVVAIMGQAADSNSGQVENIEWSALNLDGFPSVEFRPLYKIVFQCSSGYSNTIKARFTKVFDIRNLVAASPAATIGSAHSGLSGLGNDDHLQYLHVTEVRSPSAAVKASFLPPQASNAGKYLKTDGSVTSWETLTNPNNGTLTMSTSGTGISGSATFTADQAGSSTFTVTLNSSASNVVNTVVLRDGSGNFSGNVITANSFSGPLSGNASTASALATARTISSTGDVVWTTSFDGTGNVSGTANLSTTGVSSSTYGSATQVATFTVDTKGRITAASSVNIAPAWSSITGTPTTLAGYGITNGQPLDADLTAIAALTGTSGFLKKTATDTWTLDTNTYVPTNGTGATGTWGISISGNAATATTATSATSAGYATYSQVLDTRAAQYTPNDYQDFRTTYEFTNQYTGLGDWHSGITAKGWHAGYAAWQIIGPSSTTAHENWYLRSGVNTSWNSMRTILHSGNYNSYAPTLTGGGASGTWGINVTGSAGSATTATTATNWGSYGGVPAAGTSFGNANTIGRSDANGYTYFYYINSNTANGENPTVSQFIVTNGTDNFYRKASSAHVVNQLGLPNNYMRAIGYASSSNDWNSLGNTYPNTVEQVDPTNFSGTANGPTAAGYTYGLLVNFSAQSSAQAQMYISHAGNDLIFRGGWNGNTWQTWNRVLTNQNYTSYSPSLTGSGASGTWGIAITGNAATASNASNTNSISNAVGGSYTWTGVQYFQANQNTTGSNPPLQAFSTGGNGAIMSFHRGGYYAINMGLDSDNVMRIGGWSAAANLWQLDMSGNEYLSGSSRAPIFYDWDNTGYYLDPASTSELNKVYYNSNMVSRDYGIGQIGRYASTIYQAVWSMGEAYLLPANGANTGNLYGIAWSYPGGQGGASSNLASHGMLILENGVFKGAWGGGSLRTPGDVRGTIFYDWDNTGYYLDPNAVSYLYGLTLAGGSYFRPNNWIQFDGSYGLYWPNNYGAHFNDNSLSTYTQFALRGSKNSYGGFYDQYSGVNGFMYDSAGNGGIYREANGRWFAYYNIGNDCWGFGTSTTASAYNLYAPKGLYAGVRVDSPIFYDATNTGYYVDPASTSNVNQINMQGYLRRNTSAAGYMEGNYPTSVDGNSSACIYTIGGSYQPTSTTLGNMYGVGYTVGNGTANPGLGMSGWGFYVAAGGVSRVFLDGDYGIIISSGSVRSQIFYDSNNTGYYLDPTSTTSLRTVGDWRADTAGWTGEFAGKIQYHDNSWYLQFSTAMRFRNSGGSDVVTFSNGGNISASGTIAASSDERLKTNWRDLPADFVEQLAKVKAGVYDRVDEEGMTQVGVSAQSLEPLMPHAVTHNADGMLGVAYGNAALVAAVKLAERVVELERRLAALESGEK